MGRCSTYPGFQRNLYNSWEYFHSPDLNSVVFSGCVCRGHERAESLVHSALQDGCLSKEIHLFITACDAVIGKGYKDVQAYFMLPWVFPRSHLHKGRELYRIFSEWRRNSSGEMEKLRASASECLGMYAILRHWAESEIGQQPDLLAQVASLKAGCEAIDLIQMAKRRCLPMREAATRLRTTLSTWLRLHKIVYGESNIAPKFHWMFDIADQFDQDEFVIDQLVIERMHLVCKPHAERIDNTTTYERSVLSGITNSQIGSLQQLHADCCITSASTSRIAGFDHAEVGDAMDVCGMHIHVGDLVLRDQTLGKVCACVCELGSMLVIVEMLELVCSGAYYRGRWQATGQRCSWNALEISQALLLSLSLSCVLSVP